MINETFKSVGSLLRENGYNIQFMKDPFSLYSDRDCVKIEDKLNRKIKVGGIVFGDVGVKIFKDFDFPIEDAEKLLIELQEAIKLAKIVKENIKDCVVR
jgi:hypothetical protein